MRERETGTWAMTKRKQTNQRQDDYFERLLLSLYLFLWCFLHFLVASLFPPSCADVLAFETGRVRVRVRCVCVCVRRWRLSCFRRSGSFLCLPSLERLLFSFFVFSFSPARHPRGPLPLFSGPPCGALPRVRRTRAPSLPCDVPFFFLCFSFLCAPPPLSPPLTPPSPRLRSR